MRSRACFAGSSQSVSSCDYDGQRVRWDTWSRDPVTTTSTAMHFPSQEEAARTELRAVA
ncbi:hypothetical protein C8Q76DRAFT_725776 [Earliella scabrosa]|nr:hypothetical protein C8Q76DRAFT_725776 [Earliella scabrosa]